MAEAYCVKDKRKVEVQNPQQITMKNGKPALQGTCPIAAARCSRSAADLIPSHFETSTTLAVHGGGRFMSGDGGPSGL